MSATNIMNFYSQYINDSLRFHFSLYNDKLLLDEDYFIALDEANINKYLINLTGKLSPRFLEPAQNPRS